MTDKIAQPPRENLVRAVYPAVELRASDEPDAPPVLEGHFAKFNEWTEIDSVWEGKFMERIAPGAFRKTFAENRERIRPLFQHGQDPQVGDKPLGPITELEEDDEGARYKVDLLDTSYNRDLIPGLKAGLYGSSFRFSVVKEDFDKKPQRSASNPEGIPERTIREARVFEFGPVTFPAYAGATASVRSLTDVYTLNRFVRDPERLAEVIDSMRSNALPADGAASEHSDEGSRSEPITVGFDGSSSQDVTVAVAQPSPPPAVAATSTQDPPKRGSLSVRETPVMNLEELRARQDEIQARFQEIHSEHGVNRLPDDVKTEWDGLVEERGDIEARINDYEERTALLRTIADKPKNTEPVGEHRSTRTSASASRVPQNIYAVEEYRNLSNSDEQMRAAFRDGARKAIDTAVFAHDKADENVNKRELEKLLGQDESGEFARHILATGSPTYQRAFAKVIAGRPLTAEEQRAIATVGTTTTGGYNVPFTLDPTLILTSDGSVNPLRSMARVERLTQGNTWKGVTTAGVTITRGPAELQPVTPTEVTFGQPEVTVQPVKVEIQFSIEADEDWPRLQTELARILQEAKDDEEAESFVNGVGTTVYPEGVAYGLAASSDVGTTGNGLDVADLYRLEGALPPRHRARAQFLANKAIYSQIRQFSVGATGEGSVWERGIAAGDPAQLLGYPAREISTMESDPTADGERIMLFGDFRAGFLIVDKVGMTIEIDPHVRDGNGKWIGARALLAHYRNSSKVINDNALRALVVGVVTS